MADYYRDLIGLKPSQVITTKNRLSQLEAKERELDAYLAAMRALRVKHEEMRLRTLPSNGWCDEHAKGWLDCADLFAKTVIEKRHAQ